MVEWAVWWNETVDRWRGEGLPKFDNTLRPAGVSRVEKYCPDRYNLCNHFGLDPYFQYWFASAGLGCPHPKSYGGAIISDEAGYERIKPHIYPPIAQALEDIRPWVERQRNGESLCWISIEGFFWFPRTLFGIQDHMDSGVLIFNTDSRLMQAIPAPSRKTY